MERSTIAAVVAVVVVAAAAAAAAAVVVEGLYRLYRIFLSAHSRFRLEGGSHVRLLGSLRSTRRTSNRRITVCPPREATRDNSSLPIFVGSNRRLREHLLAVDLSNHILNISFPRDRIYLDRLRSRGEIRSGMHAIRRDRTTGEGPRVGCPRSQLISDVILLVVNPEAIRETRGTTCRIAMSLSDVDLPVGRLSFNARLCRK